MKTRFGWALASAMLLGGIGSAYAADMAVKAPPPPPVPVWTWSGFYVGVNGGWEQTHTTWTTFDTAAGSLSTTNNSGTAGGQAGILGQWGALVAGVEVSYNGLFGGSTTSAVQPIGAFANQYGQSDIRDLVLVTGKVGWAWNRNLVYVKGGYANADVKLNFLIGPPGFPFTTTGVTGRREGGGTVGVGWEYMFANNWSAGLEYDFARLNIGDRTYTILPGFACGNPACGTRGANADINMITARLNYHFNWAQPVVAKY